MQVYELSAAARAVMHGASARNPSKPGRRTSGGVPLAGSSPAGGLPLLSSRQIRTRPESRPSKPSPGSKPSPSLTWAQNGSWARLRVPTGRASNPGRRRPISDFTHKSRQALLELVNSVDRDALKADRVRLVTLTYPAEFPGPREAKQHLRAVLARFNRQWPAASAIWKLEPQVRGAPHFHLLVFMPEGSDLSGEVQWWARSWCDVVASGDAKHLAWHRGELGNGNRPCVEQIRTWRGVASYASKYLGKAVAGEGWESPGRWWGKHHADRLPVQHLTHDVEPRSATRLRRYMLRWLDHQPTRRFKLTHRVTGEVSRGYLSTAAAFDLAEQTKGSHTMRPYHNRRRRRSAGGAGMFMPAAAVEQLLAFVMNEVDGGGWHTSADLLSEEGCSDFDPDNVQTSRQERTGKLDDDGRSATDAGGVRGGA